MMNLIKTNTITINKLLLVLIIAVQITVQQDIQIQSCEYEKSNPDDPPPSWQHDYATRFLKSIRGSENEMLTPLQYGDWDAYYGTLIKIYVGLVIAGSLQLLFWLIQSCQVFGKFCISYFNRDYEKEPYAQYSIWLSIIASIGCGVLCVILSSLLLDQQQHLKPSISQATCQMLNELDVWIYGKEDRTWVGIEDIDEIVQNLHDQILLKSNHLGETFSDSKTKFLEDIKSIEQYITDSIAKQVGKVVNVPNPNRIVVKQIEPDIIKSMGSQDILDLNEILGSLQSDYETKSLIMADSLQKVRESSLYLWNNEEKLRTFFLEKKTQFVNLTNSFMTMKSNLTSTLEYQNKFSEEIEKYSHDLAIVIIVFVLLGCLGIGLVMLQQLIWMRLLVYIGWFVVGAFSVCVWLLSAYTYSHSLMYYEFCDAMDLYTSNQSAFKNFKTLVHDEKAETCFFGNGRLDESFNMTSELQAFEETKRDIEHLITISYLYSEDISDRFIYYWINQVNEYLKFEKKEAVEQSVLDGFLQGDLPSQSLSTLNSWSNIDYRPQSTATESPKNDQLQINCETLSRDKIVFLKSQCEGQNRPQQPSDLLRNNVCIYLEGNILDYMKTDNNIKSGTDPNYDDNFIEQRLNSIQGVTCSRFNTYKDTYQTYYKALKDYTKQILEILAAENGSVLQQFKQFEKLNKELNQKMVNMHIDVTKNLFPQIQLMLEYAINNKTGLYNNINCGFMKKNSKQIMIPYCTSHMVRMFNISMILICLGIFSILTSSSFYFATNRIYHYVISRKPKIVQPTQWTDPYFSEFKKEKVHEEGKQVILAETKFYMTGGGEEQQFKNSQYVSKQSKQSFKMNKNPNLSKSELNFDENDDDYVYDDSEDENQQNNNNTLNLHTMNYSNSKNQFQDNQANFSIQQFENSRVQLNARGGEINFQEMQFQELTKTEQQEREFARKNFKSDL